MYTRNEFALFGYQSSADILFGTRCPGGVGCAIRASHGIQIADQLADQAAKARTAATHAEFSYRIHCEILKEVMALIGGIERLFPLELDGPAARQRAVARRAKPRRRRKRRLCDVP